MAYSCSFNYVDFNLEMNCGGTILFAYRGDDGQAVRIALPDLDSIEVYRSEFASAGARS